MPDPICERPSTLKAQARLLLLDSARLVNEANNLALGEEGIPPEYSEEITRKAAEANRLLDERSRILRDPARAVNHPATIHTQAASGAAAGEPMHHFPRALRMTMLELGVPHVIADTLIATGEDKGAGKGKGKGKKGGKKGKRKRETK